MDIPTPTPDRAATLRLLAWLSPAFPVGGFSYSHGLECAAAEARVTGAQDLAGWVADLLEFGSGWNDAVLVAEAWRASADEARLAKVAALAEALSGSAERHRETTLQGAAFLAAASAWPAAMPAGLPTCPAYPVAVGAVAGAHGVPLGDTLAAWLQAFASTLLQAGIRLGLTGQRGAVATLASLEKPILRLAERAARSTLDDLGTAAMLSEIMSMRHETQSTRLFRS
ncbi:MAG: urease accessory protein UreF [Mesorhizobium sp.]